MNIHLLFKTIILLVFLSIINASIMAAVYVKEFSELQGSYVLDSNGADYKYILYELDQPIAPITAIKYEIYAQVTFPKYIDDAGNIFPAIINCIESANSIVSNSFRYNSANFIELTSYQNYGGGPSGYIDYYLESNGLVIFSKIKNDVFGTMSVFWQSGFSDGKGDAMLSFGTQLPDSSTALLHKWEMKASFFS